VDRRRTSLLLLFVFVGCTAASILIGGGRPAADQGLAPVVVQAVGSLCALVAAGLLWSDGAQRAGGVVGGAVVLLSVLDGFALADSGGGANIGAGLLRLICLLLIGMATARLAVETARTRHPR
jgi:hypothetical protein